MPCALGEVRNADPGLRSPPHVAVNDGYSARHAPCCWSADRTRGRGGLTMNIPPVTDLRWQAILRREIRHAYQFLALNLLLTRTTLSLSRDPGPPNLERAVLDIRALLERNAHLASVQHDLALLFGGD